MISAFGRTQMPEGNELKCSPFNNGVCRERKGLWFQIWCRTEGSFDHNVNYRVQSNQQRMTNIMLTHPTLTADVLFLIKVIIQNPYSDFKESFSFATDFLPYLMKNMLTWTL